MFGYPPAVESLSKGRGIAGCAGEEGPSHESGAGKLDRLSNRLHTTAVGNDEIFCISPFGEDFVQALTILGKKVTRSLARASSSRRVASVSMPACAAVVMPYRSAVG